MVVNGCIYLSHCLRIGLGIAVFCILPITILSCTKNNNREGKLFTIVPPSHSGVVFQNSITENDTTSIVEFQYIYNGGGVGIGDFNNDGLQDIVFTGNQVSSTIYLNKGNLRFQDVSQPAHFSTHSWATGVAIVDINADGWDDIYLCVGGPRCKNDCNNLLFINTGTNEEGIPIFDEQAEKYQLDDGLYSQQASFFDVDNDGDLDVYIAHNGNVNFEKNSPIPKRYFPAHLEDYLLMNEQLEGVDHPVFTNVSQAAGITHKGFSLGIATDDVNLDGYTDIYVSNDFVSEDLLYVNNGTDTKGTHLGFTETNKGFTCHQTYNAMGVDIADVNDDAYPDILVVDMLPYSYERQKRMLGKRNYNKYLLAKRNDYTPQFVHNTLQLHNGFIGEKLLRASEVSFQSGIAATDWSWAPLLADFDNDGDKDIFISNGYARDITDLDFINLSVNDRLFGTPESRANKLKALIKNSSPVPLPNFFFSNEGGAKFSNVSEDWIENQNSLSNGAAYADLDNDGDLDVIVNNINKEAFILENHSSTLDHRHYLRIKLEGNKKNKHAIGAKVMVWSESKVQYKHQSVVRGYLSSVDPLLHFGFSSISTIDSLKVLWTNNHSSTLYNIPVDTSITIRRTAATNYNDITIEKSSPFTANDKLISYTHKGNNSHDFTIQHLFMRQYSKQSPCIAIGNIDGRRGDEIFIGGNKGRPSQIWYQKSNGTFYVKQELDTQYQDVDAVFEDIDKDGDLDLYVASGGIQFKSQSKNYQDRIYVNNGKGHFSLSPKLLPKHYETSSCIAQKDYDQDGDIDFFIGSSIDKKKYPNQPKSQLLKNDNGTFRQIDNPDLSNVGMVTDAAWADINQDGWDDLIVVGEWMKITIFLNNKGTLQTADISFNNESGEKQLTYGWWNCIHTADIDNDGDIDFLVGNQGNNYFLQPQEDYPIYIYKKDFDSNGRIDPIIGAYYDDASGEKQMMPLQSRDDIMEELTVLKNKYYTYQDFSQANFIDLLNISNLEDETLKATTFLSSYIENIDGTHFTIHPLPQECQTAPINSMLIKDIDNDSYIDILLVGNDHTAESLYGTVDALTGIYLKGGRDGFKSIKSSVSGFYVPSHSNHINLFNSHDGRNYIIASQLNDTLKVFTIN